MAASGVCSSPDFRLWTRHYEELTVTGTKGIVRVENIVRVVYHVDPPRKIAAPRWQPFRNMGLRRGLEQRCCKGFAAFRDPTQDAGYSQESDF